MGWGRDGEWGGSVGEAGAGDSHSTLVVNSLPQRDPTDTASAARIAVSTTATLQVGSGRARDEMSTVAQQQGSMGETVTVMRPGNR